MKLRILVTLQGVLAAAQLLGAPGPDPVYVNSSRLSAPPDPFPFINAQVWINAADFSLLNDMHDVYAFNPNPLPFEAQNTRIFTNLSTMFGAPGFRFLNNGPNGTRLPMDTWVNRGAVSADYAGAFFLDQFNESLEIPNLLAALVTNSTSLTLARNGYLNVKASNIFSTGPLTVGSKGVLQIEGGTVNLVRTSLRTASDQYVSWGGGRINTPTYANDPGIEDLYWSRPAVTTMNLARFGIVAASTNDPYFGLNEPTPLRTPLHPVVDPKSLRGTNSIQLPKFHPRVPGQYATAQFTTQLNATNYVIQVVFYPVVNTADSNFTTTVNFLPDGDAGRTILVGFHSLDYDMVTQTTSSNSIYLVDALAFQTNALATNLHASTYRPNTYELTRGVPVFLPSIDLLGSVGYPLTLANSTYTNLLFYENSALRTVLNAAPSVTWAAYGAKVNAAYTASGAFTGLNDSTNMLGRVEVSGDRVNLDSMRMRGDSAVNIRAANLVSNRFARVDAPFVNFNVATTQPELLITNLAPPLVQRMNGKISCWSGFWTNTEIVSPAGTTNAVTNQLVVHALFIDHNLTGFTPVTVDRFSAKAGNVVLSDFLRIGKEFKVNATNLTFTTNAGLTLPRYFGLGASNLQNVVNFTNDGFISVQGEAYFGGDQLNATSAPVRYRNFINRGTNSASAQHIRADKLLNFGLIEAQNGLLSLDGLRVKLVGGPTTTATNYATNVVAEVAPIVFTNNLGLVFTNGFTNTGNYLLVVTTNVVTNTLAARLTGNPASIVEIRASELRANDSWITAGSLVLDVTNIFVAENLARPNLWTTLGGFQVPRYPMTNSSLMAVTLQSQATLPYQEVFHTWPAKNRGTNVSGFSNNLGLGRLILDGKENSSFRFASTRKKGAMYVDYLELRNYATNYLDDLPGASIQTETNFTIFFANANLPPSKLDGNAQGRLRWVPGFHGPLSTTNIVVTYTNLYGQVFSRNYLMNIALASSKDLDSDGDCLVNAEDIDPLYPNNGPCGPVPAPLAGESLDLWIQRIQGMPLLPPTALVPSISESIAAAASSASVGRLTIVPDRQDSGTHVVLSWESLAGAENVLEFSTSPLLTEWQTLTNFPTGPTSRRLSVSDGLSSRGDRFYRVRVLAPASK